MTEAADRGAYNNNRVQLSATHHKMARAVTHMLALISSDRLA